MGSKGWGVAALTLVLCSAGAGEAQVVAVKGGTVQLAEGEPTEATVLIRDGRIEAVGPKVKVPYDATVIDASGKLVFPGMVLAHTQGGLDRPNERTPVSPFVDVYDAINPASLFYEDALRSGITSLNVIPGNATLVGGLGRVVHPLGMTVEAMTARAPSGIKLSAYGMRGYDRVRQRAQLRQVFASLHDALERLAEKRYEEEEKKADREVKVPPAEARKLGAKLVRPRDVDVKQRNLYELSQGRLRAFLACPAAQDVPFAIELAKEQGFLKHTTFVLGSECYKAVDALKETGRPVILSGRLIHRERNPESGLEEETFVPRVFADAGVPFALQPGSGSVAEGFLWYQAARCVRGGVSRQVALDAITRTAAAAMGMSERVGEIAPGRDANLLLLSGDPLSMQTQVEAVLLGGTQVYQRAQDYRLRKLTADPAGDEGEKAAEDEAEPEEEAKPEDGGEPKPEDEPEQDGEPKPADEPKQDGPKQDGPKKEGR